LANITLVIGIALIALGLGGYFGTGTSSLTALIPAVFGAILALLGFMARDEAKRKMAMHIAVVIGLVGFLGSVPGLMKLPSLLAGQEVARPAAVISQSIMGALTAVFVALCVKSFVDARKARQAGA
jgi:sulfite exporter TauE/SafE